MEETEEEQPRRSMYDASKQIRESKFPVSRLMYVAKLNTEDRQHKLDLSDEMNRWIKDSGAQVSGLLITSGTCVVNLVESDTDTLLRLVAWNERLMKQEPAPFTAFTIPIFTEENPRRIFKFWSSTSVPPDSTGEEDPEGFLPEDISWGLYSIITEIGAKFAERYPGDQNNPGAVSGALKAILGSKKLVPKQEVLSLLLTDQFPSIQDFNDIYNTPIDIVFDNELIWPCPPELNF